MKSIPTELPGVLIVEPRVFKDDRGFFFESFHRPRYEELGIEVGSQDNVSASSKGVLRGLHFQCPNPQAKLVQVLRGAALDVAVDIRKSSPHFGKWVAVELTCENHRQLYIPAGFAHGFCALTDDVILSYKCSDIYRGECDRSIAWNDPDLGIQWPFPEPLLSTKDAAAPRLKDLPPEALPI